MAAILPQKGVLILFQCPERRCLAFRARVKFVERSNLPQEKSGSTRVTGKPEIIQGKDCRRYVQNPWIPCAPKFIAALQEPVPFVESVTKDPSPARFAKVFSAFLSSPQPTDDVVAGGRYHWCLIS